MAWFVRRRIGDAVVTFDILEDEELRKGLALAREYAYDHRNAFGGSAAVVTKVKNGEGDTVGHKTRRSIDHPFVMYVVEYGDANVY